MVVDLASACCEVDMVFFTKQPGRPAGVLAFTRPARSAVSFYAARAPRARVRWYFCEPGAQLLPFPTIFASTVWNDVYENAEQNIGEVPRQGTAKFYNGKAPLGASGQHYCGTPADFQQPKVWNPNAPFARRGFSGLPACCARVTTAAIAFVGGRSFAVPIVLTAPLTPGGELVLQSPAIPGEGSIGLTDKSAGQVPEGEVALIASAQTPIGEIGLGGAEALTASGDVALTGHSAADGELGLTDKYPAFVPEGEMGLGGETTIFGEIGLGGEASASTGEGIGMELGFAGPVSVVGGASCATATVLDWDTIYDVTISGPIGAVWFSLPTGLPAAPTTYSVYFEGFVAANVTHNLLQGLCSSLTSNGAGQFTGWVQFTTTAGFADSLLPSLSYLTGSARVVRWIFTRP